MEQSIVSVSPQNLNALLETNAELTAQLRATKRRIEFLETILQQRYDLTVKTWDPSKNDEMLHKVEALWIEARAGTGYTYEEAEQAFFDRWHFRSACVPQRMRDLRQAGKLWSKEIDGKVTFFLKLREIPTNDN